MLDANTIAEAAQSLRDDPTFESMGNSVLEIEARSLLTSAGAAFDADDVSTVINYAALLMPTPPATGNRLRDHIPAQAAMKQMEAKETPLPAPAPAPAPVVAAPPVVDVHAAFRSDSKTPLLYRVKLATNASERELADVLKMTRSTVSAYISGRLPEDLSPSQVARLRDYIERMRAGFEAVLLHL